ncbi:MAG: hypothetical protein KGH98_04000 [Candidatus Micrarchaeota archaeon]|nr:hypothetical protein [Candidatus Micrarchaeota archaeon]
MWRSQSAIEMLVTYSTALLIISLFVAVMAVEITSNPAQQFIGSQCSIQPSLPCTDSVISGYGPANPITYTLAFTNNLGTAIQFPNNAINMTVSGVGSPGQNSYLGNCIPALAETSAEVVCTVQIPGQLQPNVGTTVQSTFTLNYNICTGKTTGSCSSVVYKSTGSSSQDLLESGVSLDLLTVVANPSQSFIYVDGIEYVSGSNVLTASGNYLLLAQPQGGYTFSSWSVSGPGSAVGSTTSKNTILVLDSPHTVVIADFVPATTTTTTIP